MATRTRAGTIPTMSNPAQLMQFATNWRSALRRTLRVAATPPPPLNFSATQARGGIVLTWSPVATLTQPTPNPLTGQTAKLVLGQGTNSVGVDGYQILVSQSGDFVSDIQVIPITNVNQTSYTYPVPGGPTQFSFRIRTTSGTTSSPHTVVGPESGTVVATSLDPTDGSSTPSTQSDNYTTDSVRAIARRGKYHDPFKPVKAIPQFGAGGGGSSVTLKVNGVNNALQNVLDLVDGADINVTDLGAGHVQIASSLFRAHHLVVASANQTFPGTPQGMNPGSVGFNSNSVAATATEPAYWSGQTAATAGAQARVQSAATPSNSEITLGVLRNLEMRVSVPTTTQVRVWIGATNNVIQQSDTPTDTFGFRYSTAAGDTGWVAYSHNGTAFTTVNTGVAINTASHVFRIVNNGGSRLKFYIDGVLVATINTNIESTSTGMFAWLSVDNVGVAQARNVRLYYLYYDTI